MTYDLVSENLSLARPVLHSSNTSHLPHLKQIQISKKKREICRDEC